MNHDKSIDNIYKLDGKVPVGKAIPFGLQHILAMFVANIAPILIVAGACGLSAAQTTNLVQCAMMIAGIGSLIQLFPFWKIGSGLPIVMGISFTFVSIFCVIGPEYGYGSVVGAILVGGLVEGTLGLFAKYWRKDCIPDRGGKCRYLNWIFPSFGRRNIVWRRLRFSGFRFLEKFVAGLYHIACLPAFSDFCQILF